MPGKCWLWPGTSPGGALGGGVCCSRRTAGLQGGGDPITSHFPPRAPDVELRPSSMLTRPPHSQISRGGLSLPSHHYLQEPGGADAYRCPRRALPKAPACLPTCLSKPWSRPIGAQPGSTSPAPTMKARGGEVGLSFPAAGWFPPRPIFPHPVG